MNIDAIANGYVLDHIKAGRSMDIYHYLELDRLDCSVAIIRNVKSAKQGKKDIIKIDSLIDLNLDVLGYIDPDITVNVIRDGRLIEKRPLRLPKKLVNILRCKNPRCITSTEQELEQVFVLADEERRIYRCAYCEAQAQNKP